MSGFARSAGCKWRVLMMAAMFACASPLLATADSKAATFASGLGNAMGIATDGAGNVYVADSPAGQVKKFNGAGTLVATIGTPGGGPGMLTTPSGVALDASGNVYVADTGNMRVVKFNSSGSFVANIGAGGSACGDLVFGEPRGLAVRGTDLYVVDQNDRCVQRVSTSGVFVSKWGSSGVGVGQFASPYGVATDTVGNVYVADLFHRVQKFSASGVFDSQWGNDSQTVSLPSVATSADGRVYVAFNSGGVGGCQQKVERWTSSGTLVSSTCVSDPQGNPQVAVGPGGDVFVTSGTRVLKFAAATTAAIAQPAAPVLMGSPVAISGATSEAPFSTVAKYEWDLDGNGSYETDTGTSSNVSTTAPAAGSWTVGLRVTSADGEAATATRSIQVEPDTATASVAASPTPVLTEQAVRFDASGSTSRSGEITKYEWDFGAGFRAGSASETRSFDSAGAKRVVLRVTSRGGQTSEAEASVDVRPAPPGPDVGVSINAGAQFTNDPEVRVTMTWPALATLARFSNDGGFSGAADRPLERVVSWTLDSSGPERLPKTIYVRFRGYGDDTKTFQDDIILDETAPTISSASLGSAGAASVSARKKTYSMRVKASDRTSGVGRIQVARTKSRVLASAPYKTSIKMKLSTRPMWVRAVDRAGNVSRWRSLR